MRGYAGLPDGGEWVRDRVAAIASSRRARRGAGRADARRGRREILDHAELEAAKTAMSARPGVVYLVGAGPGDPGLMTARALELIASADVDPPRPADPARRARGRPRRRRARLRRQGARAHAAMAAGRDRGAAGRARPARAQRRPAQGRRPVRLRPRRRGGRGAGARPGSSSRSSRGSPPGSRRPRTPGSRSPTATTPRRSPSSPATRTPRRPRRRSTGRRWRAFPGTLVLYMGVKNLPDDRRSAWSRPGAIRTSPRRRSSAARSPASAPWSRPSPSFPARSPTRASAPPAILLFGPVAARREAIAWLERRPLHGRRVVVTRARAQASGLAATLRGARRRGDRAAGDPDRAADRDRRRSATRSPRSTPTRSSA